MKTVRTGLLAAALAVASFAQSIVVPGYTNPNVSLSWLYYNKMRWAGAWSSSATYNPQDVVTYSGLTYVSLSVANLNNPPATSPTWWTQLPSNFSLPSGSQTQLLRIQPNTGNNTTYQFASLPELRAADYAFPAQTPGGSLVAGGAGQSVTMTPCPLGAAGTNSNYWLYLSGGTGTAEPVLVTGGSCTSGAASGTLQFTPTNAHSGAFTVGPANGGISEAIWSLGSAGGTVVLPAGTVTVHAPIRRLLNTPIWVRGQGQQSTILAVASDFPTSGVNGVLDWSPGDGAAVPIGGASDLTISFIQPDSTNVATYTHWPPAVYTTGSYHSEWKNLTVLAAWDGFTLSGNNNGAQFYNITGSYFDRMFNLEPTGHSFDTVRIVNFQGTTTGLTANQSTAFLASGTGNIGIYCGSVDDLKVDGGLIGSALVADFHQGSDGGAVGAEITGLWSEGSITVSDGSLKINNLHFSGGAATNNAITLSRGVVSISNSSFDSTETVPVIFATPTGTSTSSPFSSVMISNTKFNTLNTDTRSVQCSTGGSYTGVFNCVVVGNTFNRNSGIAYSNATVTTIAGTGDPRLVAIGNTFSDVGAGSGNAIALDTDTWHVVTGNQGGGWAFTIAGHSKTQWLGNPNFGTNINYLLDPLNLPGGTATATAGSATLGKQTGTVTSESITTAAGSTYTLTVSNGNVSASSQIYANAFLGSSTQGTPQVIGCTPGSGSIVCVVKNIHATQAFNGTIKVQFLVVNN